MCVCNEISHFKVKFIKGLFSIYTIQCKLLCMDLNRDIILFNLIYLLLMYPQNPGKKRKMPIFLQFMSDGFYFRSCVYYYQGLAAAHKTRIWTQLCTRIKILKKWIVCLGTGLVTKLNFKGIIWRCQWGLHAGDARLPSIDYYKRCNLII